jgi:hypothetical protein
MQASVNCSEYRMLQLPPSISSSLDSVKVQSQSSVVVIGANGSGKTRFGSWIELHSPERYLVHRIASQRSLSIPDYCSTSSQDAATNNLLYGYHQENLTDEQTTQYKIGRKWQSKPNTALQNDYDKLLTFLFTEDYQKSTKYRQQCKTAELRETPPETHLDIIKRIWESVLPHRELITDKVGKIEARPKSGGNSYHGAEMSDGERVIFYLIGQCLAAKEKGIIIIDEPELHLHKALQSRLWDAVEAERPDCLFIYLTHDLDFAVTRVNSTKIWLKSYDNDRWDWHLIPENDEIPENLLLEIIGSRKPILFVEGDKKGLDYLIFSHLFKDYTVIPHGGCADVIYATCSFSRLKNLHGLDCKGIIDRDFRNDEQINKLKDKGIFCLDFSEIENVLLSEDVLKIVGDFLHREDIDKIIGDAKNKVFTLIKEQKERLVSSIVAFHIEDAFKTFNAKAIGEEKLKESLDQMVSTINLPCLYQETSTKINRILENQDYSQALRLYNNKGLLPQVSNLFGFKGNGLVDYIKRLIPRKENEKIIRALRNYLPELPTINQDEDMSKN